MRADHDTAKLFTHGGSQAVRFPERFRLPGREVRVLRTKRGVLLQPLETDPKELRTQSCFLGSSS